MVRAPGIVTTFRNLIFFSIFGLDTPKLTTLCGQNVPCFHVGEWDLMIRLLAFTACRVGDLGMNGFGDIAMVS